MARIKIEIPQTFQFQTSIPVRITDINYGGHVGNDSILSLIHEARMMFLANHGYTEINFGGVGLIMADAGIEFKHELFYGDELLVSIAVTEFSKISFEIYYKLEKKTDAGLLLIARAKTGMVCYDYQNRKIAAVPPEVRKTLDAG